MKMRVLLISLGIVGIFFAATDIDVKLTKNPEEFKGVKFDHEGGNLRMKIGF